MVEVPMHRLEPEAFAATPQLRWSVRQGWPTPPPVLEQLWRGHKGSQEWRSVPVEVVP
jgi:hypothetical protein